MSKTTANPAPRLSKRQRLLSALAKGQLFGQGFRVDVGEARR